MLHSSFYRKYCGDSIDVLIYSFFRPHPSPLLSTSFILHSSPGPRVACVFLHKRNYHEMKFSNKPCGVCVCRKMHLISLFFLLLLPNHRARRCAVLKTHLLFLLLLLLEVRVCLKREEKNVKMCFSQSFSRFPYLFSKIRSF